MNNYVEMISPEGAVINCLVSEVPAFVVKGYNPTSPELQTAMAFRRILPLKRVASNLLIDRTSAGYLFLIDSSITITLTADSLYCPAGTVLSFLSTQNISMTFEAAAGVGLVYDSSKSLVATGQAKSIQAVRVDDTVQWLLTGL